MYLGAVIGKVKVAERAAPGSEKNIESPISPELIGQNSPSSEASAVKAEIVLAGK